MANDQSLSASSSDSATTVSFYDNWHIREVVYALSIAFKIESILIRINQDESTTP